MPGFLSLNKYSPFPHWLSCLGFRLGLCLKQTTFGEVRHFGVFCGSLIAKGVRFGPFQGKVVNASEVKTYGDNSLMWEVNECFWWVGQVGNDAGGEQCWPLASWENPSLGTLRCLCCPFCNIKRWKGRCSFHQDGTSTCSLCVLWCLKSVFICSNGIYV